MMINTDTDYNGVFYKVKDDNGNTRGYIYGTTHYNNDPNFKINEKVIKAFDKSESISLEANVFELKKFVEFKAQYLSSEKANSFENFFDYVSSSLINGVFMDIDLHIRAHKSQKKIVFLEETDLHEKICKKLEKIKEELKKKLEVLPNNESLMTEEQRLFKEEYLEHLQLLATVHKTSNESSIKKVSRFGVPETLNSFFEDERNIKMTEKLNSLFKKNEKHFCAIGAVHCISDEMGVIKLLREMGWTLKQVFLKPDVISKVIKEDFCISMEF